LQRSATTNYTTGELQNGGTYHLNCANFALYWPLRELMLRAQGRTGQHNALFMQIYGSESEELRPANQINMK
jgi:hypothetical protein